MPSSLKSSVTRLIKAECPNYDTPTGLCLPLDCPCVQLNSMVSLQQCGYLSCNHFGNNVLPLNKELLTLIARRQGEDTCAGGRRKCVACARRYMPTGRSQKYCASCAKAMRKIKEAARMREYRQQKAG